MGTAVNFAHLIRAFRHFSKALHPLLKHNDRSPSSPLYCGDLLGSKTQTDLFYLVFNVSKSVLGSVFPLISNGFLCSFYVLGLRFSESRTPSGVNPAKETLTKGSSTQSLKDAQRRFCWVEPIRRPCGKQCAHLRTSENF